MRSFTVVLSLFLAAGPAAAQGLSSAFGAAQTILKGGAQGVPAGIAAPRIEGRSLETARADKEMAPDFKLKDLDGKDVSLARFRGKVVLLEFGTTGCHFCKKAVPFLRMMHMKYAEKGLVVIWVNRGEDAKTVKDYVWAQQLPYLTVLDPGQKVWDSYRKEYRFGGVPSFVLVGPDGEKVWSALGYGPQFNDRYEKAILDALGLLKGREG